MFGLSELKKTRVFQEGREEGREEAIVALLQRRFGTVDAALSTAITNLPHYQYLQLSIASLSYHGKNSSIASIHGPNRNIEAGEPIDLGKALPELSDACHKLFHGF